MAFEVLVYITYKLEVTYVTKKKPKASYETPVRLLYCDWISASYYLLRRRYNRNTVNPRVSVKTGLAAILVNVLICKPKISHLGFRLSEQNVSYLEMKKKKTFWNLTTTFDPKLTFDLFHDT